MAMAVKISRIPRCFAGGSIVRPMTYAYDVAALVGDLTLTFCFLSLIFSSITYHITQHTPSSLCSF